MYLNNLRDFICQLVAVGVKIILALIIAELIVIAIGVIVLTAKGIINAVKKEREGDGEDEYKKDE